MTFALWLIDPEAGGDGRFIRRCCTGLGLAAIYGAAAGARYGLLSMAVHAAGTVISIGIAAAVTTPSLYVALSHADLPVPGAALMRAVASGIAQLGFLLAGMAPAVMMLSVSAESSTAAAACTALGFAVAGVLSLRRTCRDVLALQPLPDPPKPSADAAFPDHAADDVWDVGAFAHRGLLRACLFGYRLTCSIIALRLGWLTLPMLGGGQ